MFVHLGYFRSIQHRLPESLDIVAGFLRPDRLARSVGYRKNAGLRARKKSVLQCRAYFDAIRPVEAHTNVGRTVPFGAILTGILVDYRPWDTKGLFNGMAGGPAPPPPLPAPTFFFALLLAFFAFLAFLATLRFFGFESSFSSSSTLIP